MKNSYSSALIQTHDNHIRRDQGWDMWQTIYFQGLINHLFQKFHKQRGGSVIKNNVRGKALNRKRTLDL